MNDSVELVDDFGEDEAEAVSEVFLEFEKVVLVFFGGLDFFNHGEEVAEKGQVDFVEAVDFALQKVVCYLLATTEHIAVLLDRKRVNDERIPKGKFCQDKIEIS